MDQPIPPSEEDDSRFQQFVESQFDMLVQDFYQFQDNTLPPPMVDPRTIEDFCNPLRSTTYNDDLDIPYYTGTVTRILRDFEQYAETAFQQFQRTASSSQPIDPTSLEQDGQEEIPNDSLEIPYYSQEQITRLLQEFDQYEETTFQQFQRTSSSPQPIDPTSFEQDGLEEIPKSSRAQFYKLLNDCEEFENTMLPPYQMDTNVNASAIPNGESVMNVRTMVTGELTMDKFVEQRKVSFCGVGGSEKGISSKKKWVRAKISNGIYLNKLVKANGMATNSSSHPRRKRQYRGVSLSKEEAAHRYESQKIKNRVAAAEAHAQKQASLSYSANCKNSCNLVTTSLKARKLM